MLLLWEALTLYIEHFPALDNLSQDANKWFGNTGWKREVEWGSKWCLVTTITTTTPSCTCQICPKNMNLIKEMLWIKENEHLCMYKLLTFSFVCYVKCVECSVFCYVEYNACCVLWVCPMLSMYEVILLSFCMCVAFDVKYVLCSIYCV